MPAHSYGSASANCKLCKHSNIIGGKQFKTEITDQEFRINYAFKLQTIISYLSTLTLV